MRLKNFFIKNAGQPKYSGSLSPSKEGYDKKDLIEDVVRWRMAEAYDTKILDWRSPDCIFDRADRLNFAQLGGFVIRPEEVEMLPPKNAQHIDPWKNNRLREYHSLLVQLHGLCGGDFRERKYKEVPIVCHVQDGNVFPYLEPHRRQTLGVTAALTPNRLCVSRDARSTQILLPRRHLVNTSKCPTYSRVPWKERHWKIFWRGQLTGLRYDFDTDGDVSLTGMRNPSYFASDYVLRAIQGGPFEIETLRSYQRIRAVIDHKDSDQIDLAITEVTDGREIQAGDYVNEKIGFNLFQERLEATSYAQKLEANKARLAIPGNDVASSLIDDLMSDATVLMPEPFHEQAFHYGLIPWKHYVPLQRNLQDLTSKLAWCEANDSQAYEIALAGQNHASIHFERDFELAVAKRTLMRIAENTHRQD